VRRVTVDSSLAAKWFLEEAGSSEAQRLLDDWSAGAQVWAPDLIWVECANAARHKVEARELPQAFALRLLAGFLGAEIRTVPSREIAKDALAVALHTGLTVWDASYVAVARRLNAELWTADRQMATRAPRAHADTHLLTWTDGDAGPLERPAPSR